MFRIKKSELKGSIKEIYIWGPRIKFEKSVYRNYCPNANWFNIVHVGDMEKNQTPYKSQRYTIRLLLFVFLEEILY